MILVAVSIACLIQFPLFLLFAHIFGNDSTNYISISLLSDTFNNKSDTKGKFIISKSLQTIIYKVFYNKKSFIIYFITKKINRINISFKRIRML